MYKFVEENGVSLYCGEKALLKNITAWVNPTLFPWDPSNFAGKAELKLKSVTENAVYFLSLDEKSEFVLKLQSENTAFALYLSGTYTPVLGYGSHLDIKYGCGIDFDLQKKGNYIDNYIYGTFWQVPFISKKLSELKAQSQAIFVNLGADKAYYNAVCDKAFKTEFMACGERTSLVAHSNTVCDSIDECILVGSCGNDEYALPTDAVAYGLRIMEKPGMLRKDKKYPEVLEYLGWCSWDAFHMDVTEQNLLDKAKEFKDKEIPVRWMIIDDMWGDVSAIDRKTMHDREINSWEADPVRFPNGLKGVVKHITENYGIKVGIWHPTSGYWHGINPNGALAKEHGDLLELTIPKGQWEDAKLIHSFDEKKVEKYYDLQHKFYKECGIEFTKVDNQGNTEKFSRHKGTIAVCAKNLHRAIEKAAKKYYGGALINCMGMPTENFWNRTYSAVDRFSGDFQPEDRKWFVQHLLQCSYNCLTQGTVFVGDWDMWWSDDKQASKNAVLRSMSGGPIYMSDELNRSVKSVIMPTVLSDGRIVRLNSPALPAKECLFADSEHNGKIFKVFNKEDNFGVVASFNMDKNEKPVSGSVSYKDINGLKKGKYAVYDWFNGKVTVLENNEKIDLTLNNYDDFRLHLFVPVCDGRAVIGLKEKYMSPATVKAGKKSVTALDDGTLLVYSEKALDGFTALGDGLYSKTVKKDEKLSF